LVQLRQKQLRELLLELYQTQPYMNPFSRLGDPWMDG
jgi:hypothetical protein